MTPVAMDAVRKDVEMDNAMLDFMKAPPIPWVSVETLYTMEQPVAGMDYLSMLQANLTALKKEIH